MRSRITRFADWRLGTKIAGGFVAMLAVTAVVALAASAGLLRANGAFGDYRTIAGRVAALGALHDQVSAARLAADLYRAGDAAERQALSDAIGGAKALLQPNAAGQEDVPLAAIGDALDRLDHGFGRYADALDAAARLQHAFDDDAAALDKAASDLLALLAAGADVKQQMIAADIGHAIMDSRLAAETFMRTPSAETRKRAVDLLQAAADGNAELSHEPNVRPFAKTLAALDQKIASLTQRFAALADNVQASVAAQRDDVLPAGVEADRAIAQSLAAARQAADGVGRAARFWIVAVWIAVDVCALFGLALALKLARTLGRSIGQPIVAVTDAMRRLADGDRAAAIPRLERQDEIGDMIAALHVFQARAVALEAFEVRAVTLEDKARGFEADAMDTVDALARAAGELGDTAGAMLRMADETSGGASAAAAGSAQAAANVQRVAGAAEELRGSVAEISRQVARSTDMAARAVAQAETTDAKMQGLAEAARRIGAIVAIIQKIAARTNLLALNATIEAARAGQAGKGFAVVAGEVKALALQTASATDEIRGTIAEIHGATASAVEAIASIGAIIGDISAISDQVAATVDRQNSAADEIARNAREAAGGTHDVSANIAGVTRAADETRAVADRVLHAAGRVAAQSSAMKTTTTGFLDGLRAA